MLSRTKGRGNCGCTFILRREADQLHFLLILYGRKSPKVSDGRLLITQYHIVFL